MAAGLLHAAHAHAHVLGLKHHHDALRIQLLDQGVGNLRSQTLLHLRTLRIHFDQTRQLRQAAHTAVGRRDVGDVGLAEERHQVMLAHGVEIDVAHKHHFAAVLIERGGEMHSRVFRQAGEHLFVHTGNACRRLLQTLAVGILAHAFQNHANAGFDLCSIHTVIFLLAVLNTDSAA